MSVYFAHADAYIKIGYSADPFSRVSTVTTNGTRPEDLPRGADARLIGWIPGDRNVEAALHRRFAADHVFGEWFYLDLATVRDVIWDDPCGIDINRMSAFAVLAANKNPGVSRDELTAAGIALEPRHSADDFWASFMDSRPLGGAA